MRLTLLPFRFETSEQMQTTRFQTDWRYPQQRSWYRNERQGYFSGLTSMTLNKIHLIYNPKNKETFHSARWRQDYFPDLLMITQDPEGDDITTTCHISNGFPRSQHRSVFLHYGLRIPLTRSVPKHRWNVARADCDRFAKDLDHVIHFILAESDCCSQTSHYPWFSKTVHSGMGPSM
jgi:hypothetical protein